MNLNPLRWLEKRFALTNPPQWFMDFLNGGLKSTAGETVTVEAAMATSPVFACNRVISETLGSLPLHTYRRLTKGKEKASEDPVYRMLHDEPNPEMTSMRFRETLTSHALLWGNGYAEIERDGAGRPVRLWPLRPDRTKPMRNGLGELMYEVKDDLGNPTYIPRADVLHIAGLGFDGVCGYSVIRLAAESMGLTIATEKYGGSFFGNGARPGGYLQHPGRLSEPAHANLRKQFEGRHQGAANGNRLAILEEGMTFNASSIPPEEAQFLETRQFQVVDICRWFRVPPHKVAELSRATFSNIEHQSIEFVTDTIRPWAVRWEQEVNRKLFGIGSDLFCEHLFDGLLRGDLASRYTAYQTARQNGWFSANDIRELENMNPIEGGDQYLVNGNMIPADMAGKLTTSNPAGTQAEPAGRTIDAMVPILADAYSRLYRLEKDKRERGKTLPETHESHVRSLFQPIVEALAEYVGYRGTPTGACNYLTKRHMERTADADPVKEARASLTWLTQWDKH
jgi:HK97 family phage portal protein